MSELDFSRLPESTCAFAGGDGAASLSYYPPPHSSNVGEAAPCSLLDFTFRFLSLHLRAWGFLITLLSCLSEGLLCHPSTQGRKSSLTPAPTPHPAFDPSLNPVGSHSDLLISIPVHSRHHLLSPNHHLHSPCCSSLISTMLLLAPLQSS